MAFFFGRVCAQLCEEPADRIITEQRGSPEKEREFTSVTGQWGNLEGGIRERQVCLGKGEKNQESPL